MAKMKYLPILGCMLFVVLITSIVWYRTQTTMPPAVIVPHYPTPTLPALVHSPTDGFGLYEDCSPSRGEACFARLAQMASSGFKLVMNYSQLSGTIDQQLRYAYQAKLLGMKIIWNFADPRFIDGVSDVRAAFPALAQTCGCSNTIGFISYVVNQVKYLPATWGYYVGDEVTVDKYNEVKALSDLIHEMDSHHPRLLVMRSITPAVNPGLTVFADAADVLAQDFYPIGHYKSVNGIGSIASGVQAVAQKYHKDTGMVLQSFSLEQYRSYHNLCSSPATCPYPTTAQMQQMRDLVLQHATVRLMLWFSYESIQRSDEPTLRWHNLQAAIQT